MLNMTTKIMNSLIFFPCKPIGEKCFICLGKKREQMFILNDFQGPIKIPFSLKYYFFDQSCSY